MLNKEKIIKSDVIYEGGILKLRRDKVLTCNGGSAYREIVIHNGGVGVVAITDDKKICLVRQHRIALDDFLIEIPAGKLEANEDIKSAAERELSEETGYTAENMLYLGYIVMSPGYCTEKVHLYMATGLIAGKCHFDEDEELEILEYDFSKAVEMVMNGELTDAKTVYGILKAKRILEVE